MNIVFEYLKCSCALFFSERSGWILSLNLATSACPSGGNLSVDAPAELECVLTSSDRCFQCTFESMDSSPQSV